MSNPYNNPYVPNSPAGGHPGQNGGSKVDGPAIALMIVAGISFGVVLLGLAFDVFIIAFGLVDDIKGNRPQVISPTTQLTIRITWSVLLLASSAFVLYGALKMKQRLNFGVARAAAIVACIPMLGPCCICGIPFGIWALVVLAQPGVRAAFRS